MHVCTYVYVCMRVVCPQSFNGLHMYVCVYTYINYGFQVCILLVPLVKYAHTTRRPTYIHVCTSASICMCMCVFMFECAVSVSVSL